MLESSQESRVDKDEDYSTYVSGRWAALVRFAVLLGCSRHDAEDLAQTTLVRCYVSWDKGGRASDRDAYVYHVLLNARATSRRRLWWRERPTGRLPDQQVEDETAATDLTDNVQRALARLSEQQRRVVVLRYSAVLTERQTADVLGVPAGTVKSRLSRAIAAMADGPDLADVPGWSLR